MNLTPWHEASLTTLSYFWKAFWAFCLGYLISAAIQIFVTRERMQKAMGSAGAKSVVLATFFGFISSSCSFAALATTRALFRKGAGLIPSLAFLLASTNLVIELGIVIAIFLGWQFIVGEYAGGILLILVMIVVVKFSEPRSLVERVRRRMRDRAGGEASDQSEQRASGWRSKIRSRRQWGRVGSKYFMEWMMVWKDVTVGFTVAGIITVFVPRTFFEWLFIGTGDAAVPDFLATLEHALVGPLAAFFTFIGSMGNIPLAAVLFSNGVSFAGIMAFIFSDLIVFPVLRLNAKFYGWRLALYIAAVFLLCIVVSALAMHWSFAALDLLPRQQTTSATTADRFALNHTFWLNLAALGLSAGLAWLARHSGQSLGTEMVVGRGWIEKLLAVLAVVALVWLAGGLAVA
jgi:hypothetical protein